MLTRMVPGARDGVRIVALLLMLDGQRPGWIAQTLGLSRMSLNRWIHKVNKEGIGLLRSSGHAGRSSRLTPSLRRALLRDLARSPLEVGLTHDRWSGPALVTHLKQEFGVKLKVRQAQNWIHHLGFRRMQVG